MTGREKIEAALSADGTPQIPAVICYEGIYIRDHWDQLTKAPWWHQFVPDRERQLAWRREVIAATGQDWLALPSCASRRDRETSAMEVRGEDVFRVNIRTGEQERLERPHVGGWSPTARVQSVRPEYLAATPDEIDERIRLRQQLDANEFRAAGCADLADLMLAEYGMQIYPIQAVLGPLWLTYELWGFEGMMTMAAAEPELVEHACRRYLAVSIARAQQAAALGAAAIWIEDCLTDMVSPEAFARLNLPYLHQLTDEIRDLGMKSIYYYCGDPADRWDLLLDSGADALSLEEGKKGFDIDIEKVVAQAQGRMAVLGNLDAIGVLQDGTEEELRAEISRQIAAGRRNGSRFIMSLGSPVTPGTPVERVRLYCEIVHELGSA